MFALENPLINFFNLVMPIVMTLIVALPVLAYLLLRKPATGGFTSASAPASPRQARRAEALVVAILASGILLITQVTEHVGGFLPRLGDLAPGRAGWYWSVIAVTVILIGAGVFLVWRGRSALGIASLATVLCVYGAIFNSGSGFFSGRTSGWGNAETSLYRIVLTDQSHGYAEIDGVDVWIAGEHVGKTPVEMTVAEFMKLVPEAMPKPEPDDPERSREWIRFQGPRLKHGRFDWVETYAKAALSGEPAFSGGGSSGGGGDRDYTTTASVYFPNRDAEIEQLLDLARLSDYAVDADWLGRMKVFDESGIRAIRSKLELEPGFAPVVAALRGEPQELVGDAWAEFEKILNETDKLGVYETDSELGRRVERIALKLDPDKLANLAANLARKPAMHQSQWGWRAGVFELSGKMLRTPSLFSPPYMPARAYPVGHAVWLVEAQFDPAEPNIFELRVTPELLRWHSSQDSFLKLARTLGGPAYEEFVRRQDWRRDWEAGDDGFMQNRFYLGTGVYVNRWFWERLNWPGGRGREFRWENRGRLFELVDEMLEVDHNEDKVFEALFADCAAGDRELAEEYWPRFRRFKTDWGGFEPVKMQFDYLVRMRLPVGEAPARFVEVFAEFAKNPEEFAAEIGHALGVLEDLPVETRIGVYRALARESLRVAESMGERDRYRSNYALSIPRQIETALFKLGDAAAVEAVIADDSDRLDDFAEWLRDEAPDHELVAEFAGHAEARVRAIVPPVAAAHPTPRNRALLAKLENDPSDEVQRAVADAKAALEELRESR